MNVAKIQSLEKATLDPFIKKPLLLGKGQTKQNRLDLNQQRA